MLTIVDIAYRTEQEGRLLGKNTITPYMGQRCNSYGGLLYKIDFFFVPKHAPNLEQIAMLSFVCEHDGVFQRGHGMFGLNTFLFVDLSNASYDLLLL